MPTTWMPRTVLSRNSTDHTTARAGCYTFSMLITPIGTAFCAYTISPWAVVPAAAAVPRLKQMITTPSA